MIYTRSLCVFGGRSVKLIGYIIRIIFASKFWLRSDWNWANDVIYPLSCESWSQHCQWQWSKFLILCTVTTTGGTFKLHQSRTSDCFTCLRRSLFGCSFFTIDFWYITFPTRVIEHNFSHSRTHIHINTSFRQPAALMDTRLDQSFSDLFHLQNIMPSKTPANRIE